MAHKRSVNYSGMVAFILRRVAVATERGEDYVIFGAFRMPATVVEPLEREGLYFVPTADKRLLLFWDGGTPDE